MTDPSRHHVVRVLENAVHAVGGTPAARWAAIRTALDAAGRIDTPITSVAGDSVHIACDNEPHAHEMAAHLVDNVGLPPPAVRVLTPPHTRLRGPMITPPPFTPDMAATLRRMPALVTELLADIANPAIVASVVDKVGPRNYVEVIETMGSILACALPILPTHVIVGTDDDLTAMGITLGEPLPGDDLWRTCTLPDGWTTHPDPHDHRAYAIHDDRHAPRLTVFYKAGPHDRHAHLTIHRPPRAAR